jgi:[acyl-carrier-protein] S-malonyltransferase
MQSKPGNPDLIVDSVVEPANFNAPGQVVIAGSVDALQEAAQLITSGAFPGGKSIPLQVSAPFHCSLMKPAREQMEKFFADLPLEQKPRALKCPYFPNRTGRMTTESSLILKLLEEQMDHPVLWEQSVLAAMESFADCNAGIEFGPGKVLQGLNKRITKKAGRPFGTSSLGDVTSLKEISKNI